MVGALRFFRHDLSSIKVKGDQCGPKCKSAKGCTHFTWTGYAGGTCYLKQSGASLDQAKYYNNYSVCSVLKTSNGGCTGNFLVNNF